MRTFTFWLDLQADPSTKNQIPQPLFTNDPFLWNIGHLAILTYYGIGYARSTDGGLSFSKARTVVTFTIYLPFDTSRDCGDGPYLFPSEFVFHCNPVVEACLKRLVKFTGLFYEAGSGNSDPHDTQPIFTGIIDAACKRFLIWLLYVGIALRPQSR